MIELVLPPKLLVTEILNSFSGQFCLTEIDPEMDICFDFSHVRTARPTGVVFLHNATRQLVRSVRSVSYTGFDRDVYAMRFLDRVGFFEDQLGRTIFEGSKPSETTCRLIELGQADCHAWVSFTFIPWLSRCTGIPEENLSEIQTCIKEVFTNIQDHAGTDVGSIFAQWYPKNEVLYFAISDFGRGIPENVLRVRPEITPEQAIQKAFEEGFTTKGRPGNLGAGLHFLRQNVVEQLNGKLNVLSGGAVIHCDFEKGFHSSKVANRNHGYTGTLINVALPTRKIDRDEVAIEDLVW